MWVEATRGKLAYMATNRRDHCKSYRYIYRREEYFYGCDLARSLERTYKICEINWSREYIVCEKSTTYYIQQIISQQKDKMDKKKSKEASNTPPDFYTNSIASSSRMASAASAPATGVRNDRRNYE